MNLFWQIWINESKNSMNLFSLIIWYCKWIILRNLIFFFYIKFKAFSTLYCSSTHQFIFLLQYFSGNILAKWVHNALIRLHLVCLLQISITQNSLTDYWFWFCKQFYLMSFFFLFWTQIIEICLISLLILDSN